MKEFLAALTGARVYDLEQPRYAGAPVFPAHEPGFNLMLHRRHERDAAESRTGASALIVTTEHSGTHIDALCHQAWDMRMHGGREVDFRTQTPAGFSELSVDTIAPIVARGVLLDAARHAGVDRLQPGAAVERLDEVAAAQGVEIRPGDVVLVRTGNGAVWSDRRAYEAGAGVGLEASRWLAARRPLAVGADTIAWDVPDYVDPELGTVPGHVVLIVDAGIYIIESLYLEELARDRRHEFGFVCQPLKMQGGTGSPVRPLALVPGP